MQQVPGIILTGGPLFKSAVVNDIINWATASQSPCFVIITDWTHADNDHVDQHISPVIQYDPSYQPQKKQEELSCQGKKRKIQEDDDNDIDQACDYQQEFDWHLKSSCVTSSGRWVLTFVAENYILPPGQPDDTERRILELNMKSPGNKQFYFQQVEDVISLLKASMEVDLWGAGMPILDDIELDPRIHMLDGQGLVASLPINTTRDNASCFNDWVAMVSCQLRMIRLLSENSAN